MTPKQNFVVNIQDSKFGKLVVRLVERDICSEFLHINPKISATIALMVPSKTRDPQTKMILTQPSSSGWFLAAKS